jgi:hypothetical protein
MCNFYSEKSSPKLTATFEFFKNVPKIKKIAIERKFAQSGHPDAMQNSAASKNSAIKPWRQEV